MNSDNCNIAIVAQEFFFVYLLFRPPWLFTCPLVGEEGMVADTAQEVGWAEDTVRVEEWAARAL